MIGLVKAAGEMEKQALTPKTVGNALQLLQKASPERLYNPTTGGLKIKGAPVQSLLNGGRVKANANLPILRDLQGMEDAAQVPNIPMTKALRSAVEAYYAQQAKQLAQSHHGASFINYLKSLGINS